MLALLAMTVLVGCKESGASGAEQSADDAQVKQLEEFAAVDIPADARDVTVKQDKNPAGDPVYRARFTTTEDGARSFCSGNGLGGALVDPSGLDQKTRDRFGIEGGSVKTPFGCKASSPQDPGVQRTVLVTMPSGDRAVVHLLAFRMPSR
jgi:hypothetical protein